jgi:hypothetical protein
MPKSPLITLDLVILKSDHNSEKETRMSFTPKNSFDVPREFTNIYPFFLQKKKTRNN